jgi:putative membrane protein
MMGHGGGTGAVVGWWLLTLVVLIGAVSAVVLFRRRSTRPVGGAVRGDAMDAHQRTRARKLLDDRYATGTVDSDEYRERLITLEQNG